MTRSVFWILFVSMVFLAGCKTFEPVAETSLSLTIPETFSVDMDGSGVIENWWFFFNSEELNTLIKNALDNNFDLKILKSKLAQAKARVEKENASFFPDLGFSFGGQKQRLQVKKDSDSDSIHSYSHSWDSALSSSYTADIWGETRASKQAQISSLQAIEQDLRTATLELTAGVAKIWIDIITARNKKTFSS